MKNNLLICIIGISILILMGCERIENNIERLNLRDNNGKQINKIKPKGSIEEFDRNSQYNIPDSVEKINSSYFDIEYNTERANRIAEIITNLPEVKKTSVIITGSTALIGLNIVSDLDQDKTRNLKKHIEDKVYSLDLSLRNVGIATSPKIINRMNDIQMSISQGERINGLANELGSIIREITPSI